MQVRDNFLKPQKVVIVSDAATGLSNEVNALHGIETANMTIAIDGHPLTDDWDEAEFYRRLAESKQGATTSAPTPNNWLQVFLKASKRANKLLCITVSRNMSSSYNSACIAAETAKTTIPTVDIVVLDSKTAAGGQALVVLIASQLANKGADTDELTKSVQEVTKKVKLIATLKTLHYLYKSGRVKSYVFWATNLLNINPIIEFKEGKATTIGRALSRKRAISRMCKYVISDTANSANSQVCIMHAGCRQEAIAIQDTINSQVKSVNTFITQFHPFMSAHTGQGLIGLAYYTT